MAVIGSTDFNTILLNDVRTAALDGGIGWDNFELILGAFCKSH
jgi:hypothetical protein